MGFVEKEHVNKIRKYARQVLRSELARADATLVKDVQTAVEGNCIYIEAFSCEKKDFNIMESLGRELDEFGEGKVVKWSQHLKHESPTFSKSFNMVVERLSSYFEVDVFATRLNFYRDGSDWKPFHKDSHAYSSNGLKEDFTMGASFGACRELAFCHDTTNLQFSVPQENGDVFAFSSDVNSKFRHGIPKLKGASNGPRFSIIAWGRRRRLTNRNSCMSETANSNNDGLIPYRNVTNTEHLQDEKPSINKGGGLNQINSVSSELKFSKFVGEHRNQEKEKVRASMRDQASQVKAVLGPCRYKEFRRISHAVQLGELTVEEYVKASMQITEGNTKIIFQLLPFLPDRILESQIQNELLCQH